MNDLGDYFNNPSKYHEDRFDEDNHVWELFTDFAILAKCIQRKDKTWPLRAWILQLSGDEAYFKQFLATWLTHKQHSKNREIVEEIIQYHPNEQPIASLNIDWTDTRYLPIYIGTLNAVHEVSRIIASPYNWIRKNFPLWIAYSIWYDKFWEQHEEGNILSLALDILASPFTPYVEFETSRALGRIPDGRSNVYKVMLDIFWLESNAQRNYFGEQHSHPVLSWQSMLDVINTLTLEHAQHHVWRYRPKFYFAQAERKNALLRQLQSVSVPENLASLAKALAQIEGLFAALRWGLGDYFLWHSYLRNSERNSFSQRVQHILADREKLRVHALESYYHVEAGALLMKYHDNSQPYLNGYSSGLSILLDLEASKHSLDSLNLVRILQEWGISADIPAIVTAAEKKLLWQPYPESDMDQGDDSIVRTFRNIIIIVSDLSQHRMTGIQLGWLYHQLPDLLKNKNDNIRYPDFGQSIGIEDGTVAELHQACTQAVIDGIETALQYIEEAKS